MKAKSDSGKIRERKLLRWFLFLAILLVFSGVAFMIGLSTGEMDIPLRSIPGILLAKEGIEYVVLYQVRLPRILLALAVGGGLSLSGAILQGIYRNPLVEPYTLGISGGAALGVALAIVLALPVTLGAYILPLAGFLGALVAIFLVYSLGIRQGSINVNNMLLIGVMVSFVSSAFMMLLMSITTAQNLHSIVFWMMGSLDEPDGTLIRLTIVVSLAALVSSMFFFRPLNALRLGETDAMHLGVNTETSIRVLFVIASLLAGVCVAAAGVIGFVGLVIPHFVRMIAGSDYRMLLPGSFLGGGIFLVICDAVARTVISPNELPIGVITGIIGGTMFILFLSRSRSSLKMN